jgi:hypothetical protein
MRSRDAFIKQCCKTATNYIPQIRTITDGSLFNGLGIDEGVLLHATAGDSKEAMVRRGKSSTVNCAI